MQVAFGLYNSDRRRLFAPVAIAAFFVFAVLAELKVL
jgi:hypothetical protein